MQGSFTYACKTLAEFLELAERFPACTVRPTLAPSGAGEGGQSSNPYDKGPKELAWLEKSGNGKMYIGKRIKAFMSANGLETREDLAGYYMEHGPLSMQQGGGEDSSSEAPAAEGAGFGDLDLDHVVK